MDNYFERCPAMMEDGKIFSDYTQSIVRDIKIKQDNKLIDHNDYRDFLQTNGKKIIESTWDTMKKKECTENGCVFTKNFTYISNPGYFFDQMIDYNRMMQNRSNFQCDKKKDYRIGFNN